MKLIVLLILASCSSIQPNCKVVRVINYKGDTYSVSECSRTPICNNGDIWCLNATKCTDTKNADNKYNCVRRE